MDDLKKLTKAQLIEKLNSAQEQLLNTGSQDEIIKKVTLENEILKNARREDKEKVEKAEIVLTNFQQREEEILKQFEYQKALMRRDLDSQNGTIVTLFDMMDATLIKAQQDLNLQIKYYKSFKSIFIGAPEEQKEE